MTKLAIKNPKNKSNNAIDEEAFLRLIRGLNYLINEAATSNILTASRILSTAKEDLVYWAAQFDFHESKQDKFINSHLAASNMSHMIHFINSVMNAKAEDKKKLISNLETYKIENLELLKSMA